MLYEQCFLGYNFGGKGKERKFFIGFSRCLIVYREVDKKKSSCEGRGLNEEGSSKLLLLVARR